MINFARLKNVLILVACTLFLSVFLFGCAGNGTSSQMTRDGIESYLKQQNTDPYTYFNKDFEEYFAPEQYVELCQHLEKSSSSPQAAISENLIVAKQELSTYNKVEYKYVVVDTSGSVIRDYGSNSHIEDVTRIGSFAFILTDEDPYKYDILDLSGMLVGSFESKKPALAHEAELGDNYHLFSALDKGRVDLYLLNAAGDWLPIDTPDQDNLTTERMGKLETTVISEGLFGVVYGAMRDKRAIYYNLNGDWVINLSSEIVNFHIISLGAFENGKAEISFLGADEKTYDAVIDTQGNFISDPVTN